MRKKYVRMTSQAGNWAPRFGGFAFLLLLIAAILHRFSLIRTVDFLVLTTVAEACALLSLFLALKGLYDLWMRGDRGGLKSAKAIILSMMTILPIFLVGVMWVIMPPLSDISTDTDTPPVFLDNIRPKDAIAVKNILNSQAAIQMTEWPQMSGRRYDGSPDRILKSVLNVMAEQDWHVIKQSGGNAQDDNITIETQAKTFYLGFVSDIVIRLIDEGDTTFVDMRSTSRYLPRDFGANANFIMTFMDTLDKEMLSTPIDQDAE